ncbi:MAG: di-heme oxidoredictase family protein [Bacteroidota bacterium]|nr:di-heme oxidoredictase family protein [Bacteroidota bacterium]MDP4234043.1 di-heme oxidoredictase family protein [Bacteroidota bacterium]MDP4242909.1 di-heme oxidoredictase family protein [Bacteroidota bacterium]MDP4287652.1 di-heme oxidoredictase family protein [Bacteroidota bacterium]
MLQAKIISHLRNTSIVAVLVCAPIFESCSNSVSSPPASTSSIDESMSGGSQTVFVQGVTAFSQVLPNVSADHAAMHERGDAQFEAQYVPAPASPNGGLGPLFNANACSACHVNDGRGRAPIGDESMVGLLIRLSVPGTDPHGGPNPAPGFGGQLQQRAAYDVAPEADVQISYSMQTHTFADGSSYELAAPSYTIANPYMPLPAGLMTSPRVAPSVFGLGLLESIPDDEILSHADENDLDGDGISGKPNMVWDATAQTMRLGRFGWKAGQPSLIQQSAGALNEDMGITNPIFRVESCHNQTQYWAVADSAKAPEIGDAALRDIAGYMQTLGVPGRRNMGDAEVIRGKYLFNNAKCSSCHIPMMKTGTNPDFPELSNQTIFPYTDLLLHDMGPDLADNRPEYRATGSEWRTPPLWGIGLTYVVNGHTRFLHDGRARSLLEAVMWHGGEATRSREYVRMLPQRDREALVKFLESL